MNLTLKRQLKQLQIKSVGIALIVTLLFGSLSQVWFENVEFSRDVDTTANMISFNAGITLMFQDRKSAQDVLAALKLNSIMVAAALYTTDQNILAEYRRNKEDYSQIPASLKTYSNFEPFWSLRQTRVIDVLHEGERVGYLLMTYDLTFMWSKILINFSAIILGMMVAFGVSLLFSRKLAANIVTPLAELLNVTRQVSSDQNYNVRVNAQGTSEVVELMDNFNDMIAQIQQRDQTLEQHKNELEHQVAEQTRDLKQALVDAQAANEAKTRFLASMSHEIRTPMNGILGMVDVLMTTPLSSDQTKMLSITRDSALAQLSILNDILDFSKIESGKMELHIESFSIFDLVNNLCVLFDSQNANLEHPVFINRFFDPELPIAVKGDVLKLRQILTNLLSNAVKFSKVQEQPNIDLFVMVQNKDANQVELIFRVQDNGIGMDDKAIKKLFQAFEQADSSTTRQFGGSGLGLAISQSLAKLMGGHIAVTSQLNQGSIFTVYIPFELADQMERTPHQDLEETAILSSTIAQWSDVTESCPDWQDKAILVAEDNETNQEVIVYQLGLFGLRVDIAKDGQEALQLWQKKHYDLLLTDLHMPVMDGYQLTRSIRKYETGLGRSPLPIIALTAMAFKSEDIQCKQAGMDDFLTKPVNLPALKQTLIRWLCPQARAEMKQPAMPETRLSVPVESVNPIYDPEILAQYVGENLPFKQRLLQKFLAGLDEKINSMILAHQARDHLSLSEQAHALKSASQSIGALQLGKLCLDIEKAAKVGNMDYESLVEEIPECIQCLKKRLEEDLENSRRSTL
jgi:signal transduction histidine kinase/FixJ family two-component response regulator/HPt (histidine-containing phosphotransfer) domain-containing protein